MTNTTPEPASHSTPSTQEQLEEEMIAEVMKAKPGLTKAEALAWLKQMENL